MYSLGGPAPGIRDTLCRTGRIMMASGRGRYEVVDYVYPFLLPSLGGSFFMS